MYNFIEYSQNFLLRKKAGRYVLSEDESDCNLPEGVVGGKLKPYPNGGLLGDEPVLYLQNQVLGYDLPLSVYLSV